MGNLKYCISIHADYEISENIRMEHLAHFIYFCQQSNLTYHHHLRREKDEETMETKYEIVQDIAVYFSHESYDKFHEQIIHIINNIGIEKEKEEEDVPF